jgi:hypothetical protein
MFNSPVILDPYQEHMPNQAIAKSREVDDHVEQNEANERPSVHVPGQLIWHGVSEAAEVGRHHKYTRLIEHVHSVIETAVEGPRQPGVDNHQQVQHLNYLELEVWVL